MLIKEYRILLPFSTEEYRIAQLYMIQKKSIQESTGEESGVEIVENKPYENGPGGNGQYTLKIYRIASHLPSWFRNLVPKNSLSVTEKSWNAYPYTKTCYEVSFATSFKLEVETYYRDDAGDRNGLFTLSPDERKQHTVDFIDIVTDDPQETKEEEDPRKFVSQVTGRGPLADDWMNEYKDIMINNKEIFYTNKSTKPDANKNMVDQPLPKKMMCAYKLCRIEFKYWGIQSKVEAFIQDTALRKTLVKAHRQSWIWQDEWYGLTMQQIRQIEEEAKQLLEQKAKGGINDSSNYDKGKKNKDKSAESGEEGSLWSSYEKMARSVHEEDVDNDSDSDFSYSSCLSNVGNSSYFNIDFEPCQTSTKDFDYGLNHNNQENPRSPIPRDDTKITLILVVHGGSLYDYGADLSSKMSDVATFRNTLSSVIGSHYPVLKDRWAMKLVPCPPVAAETLKLLTKMNPCQVDVDRTIDSRLAHNFVPLGSIPILFTNAFDYDDQLKEVVNRLNKSYRDFLNSAEGENFSGAVHIVADALGSIITHDILQNHYEKSESRKISIHRPPTRLSTSPNSTLNQSFRKTKLEDFECNLTNDPDLNSTPIKMPNVNLPWLEFKVNNLFLLGSPIGIVLAHRLIHSSRMKSIMSAADSNYFQVKDKFLVKTTPVEPELIDRHEPFLDSTCETGLSCDQAYNIFHRTDPGAFRVEPILYDNFNLFSPHSVPQFHPYPLGDGQSASLLELIMHNVESFDRKNNPDSKCSSAPINSIGFNLSTMSKFQQDMEYNSAFSIETMKKIRKHWWGSKRIDYSVTCPEGIQNILARALPPILHASYWESKDVAAFIVRQILEVLGLSLSKFAFSVDMADEIIMSEMSKLPLNKNETIHTLDSGPNLGFNSHSSIKSNSSSNHGKSKQKTKSHTAADRLKNASSNHRANDVILDESQPQIINARFIYGNLDLLSLSNAQINIYLQSHSSNMSATPWTYLGRDVTNAHGKLRFCIPEQNRVGVGVHTIKLVPVLDPKNFLLITMAIVKKGLECVVFSVDGSFAASLSIMGSDPKVHPGSVDVARHWQGLGFMIIYLSARPDMQHRKVQAWMDGHNFPSGFYYFVERVTHDPLKQKEQILRKIIKKSGIVIHCAYGSGKDVSGYASIGLQPEQILIVGKRVKNRKATHITRYSDHLLSLMNNNALSRQANNRFNQMMSYSAFDLPSFNAKTTLSPSRSTISTLLAASGTLNTINVQFHESHKNDL